MDSATDPAAERPEPVTVPPGYGAPPDQGVPPGYGVPPDSRAARPSRRARALLISGVAAGLILVLALVLGFVLHKPETLATGPNLVVPAPATAGPLTRDHAAEAGPYKSVIQGATQALKNDQDISAQVATFEVAVYRDEAHQNPATGAASVLVYVGLQAKAGTTGSESDFMAGVAKGLGSSGHLTAVSSGAPGGRAQCADISNGSMCLWISGRSAGMLVAPGAEFSQAQLAAIMRAARPAFQRARSSAS